MARRHRLKEIEREKGDLHKIIPSLVNEHGQGGAARILGISQASVSMWLKDNGYTMKMIYVKEGAQAS